MAHQWFRANISNSIFPFLTKWGGRTVIIPQADQDYDPSSFGSSAKKENPQAYYMHNVMPTVQGYQSVAYDTAILASTTSPVSLPLTAVFPGFWGDGSGNRYLLASIPFFSEALAGYIYDQNYGYWLPAVLDYTSSTLVSLAAPTIARLNGITLICYPGLGIYSYNGSVTAGSGIYAGQKIANLVSLNGSLTGVTPSDIAGICAANGYLLLWDNNSTIYNSNANNIYDFVPSAITGASSFSPEDLKGGIVAVLPISGGFITYSTQNAVGASYTGNINYPWVLKEIPGIGGITSPECVSWQANLDNHYIWSTAGFQQVSLTQDAIDDFPEVTDFFVSKIYEDFDEDTLQFSSVALSDQMLVKVNAINNRFIVVSYGQDEYTYALIFDVDLRRWGKVKVTHTDSFQWNSPNLEGALSVPTYQNLAPRTYETLGNAIIGNDAIPYYAVSISNETVPEEPKETIAFLQHDGTTLILDFEQAAVLGYAYQDFNISYDDPAIADATYNTFSSATITGGVLLLGKYQVRRSSGTIHQRGVLEGVSDTSPIAYYIIPTFDGKTLQLPVPGIVISNGIDTITFGKRVTAFNFSVLIVGVFDLSSVLLDMMTGETI